jgi:hypothetical protein
VKTGLKCKLYRNSANYASPTWVETTIVGDLSVTAAWDWATAPTRESAIITGARTTLPLSAKGKMRCADTDANYIAFDDAFHNSSAVVDLMILNGDQNTNGVTGFRCEFEVVDWGEDQALANALMKDFEVRPSATGNLPKRAKVASGAVAFTNII